MAPSEYFYWKVASVNAYDEKRSEVEIVLEWTQESIYLLFNHGLINPDDEVELIADENSIYKWNNITKKYWWICEDNDTQFPTREIGDVFRSQDYFYRENALKIIHSEKLIDIYNKYQYIIHHTVGEAIVKDPYALQQSFYMRDYVEENMNNIRLIIFNYHLLQAQNDLILFHKTEKVIDNDSYEQIKKKHYDSYEKSACKILAPYYSFEEFSEYVDHMRTQIKQ